jgi:hypothetical protein
MDYRFTAVLIILLCLLALFVRPAHHTPLKSDQKETIIPLPKPKVDEEAAWNEIE